MFRRFLSLLPFILFACFIRAEDVKVPVLCLCQHQSNTSSWSVSVVVSKENPKLLKRVLLDELSGVNSKDRKYSGVVAAHRQVQDQRPLLTSLEAADFGTKQIDVDDGTFTLGLVPVEGKGYRLDASAKIQLDKRFGIGNTENSHGIAYLKYCDDSKTWKVYAESLTCTDGSVKTGVLVESIVFLSGSTLVSLILAVDEETHQPIKLLDR